MAGRGEEAATAQDADAAPEPALHAASAPPALLTRAVVARRLGVSVTAVRLMEGRQLHPTIDPRGRRLFDPGEVARVAATRRAGCGRAPGAGELAARVFQRLDDGATLRQLVIDLRQPPELIRALYDEWRTDFEAGVKRRARQEAEKRAEREAREIAAINRTYDAEARRLDMHQHRGASGADEIGDDT